jgi:soluble cytochrome b562
MREELEDDTPNMVIRWANRLRLPTSLKFWAIVTVVVSGTFGFTAMALLFKLPALPNCPAIYWPMASASLRMYCADLAANKQTVDDLLEAIALVDSLPSNHPLRSEINRKIEEWALDILKLADQSFQDGNLDEAIATARKIPSKTPAYNLVEARIEHWQAVWTQAEDIYQKVEEFLGLSKWREAFREAVKLTNLSNNYWSTTKFDELVNLIQVAKEDSNKLDKADRLAKKGGLDNLLEAVNIAEKLGSQSYFYKKAQDFIIKCGEQLLELAQELLDKGDWQSVQKIATTKSTSLKLDAEFQDLSDLANALSRAQEGTIPDLEQAITVAQKLTNDRPLYAKAQQLIGRWQLEIQDVAHLDRARTFASSGQVNDLRTAIAEAALIPGSNPRGSEARNQVNRWVVQVETIEDQPLLDRAQQMASFGNLGSLQNAIAQASQIRRGRALYQQAQNNVRDWTQQVQRMQDQPVLDQAESQANSGNLSRAISVAQQIRPGRVLYGEAKDKIRRWLDQLQRSQDQPLLDQAESQANAGNLNDAVVTAQQIKSGRVLSSAAAAKIRTWQTKLQAEQNLNSAYQLASNSTPEALAAAIQAARQVPTASKLRADANDAVNRWSNQLLAMAQAMAVRDVQGAIAIAKNIPPRTDAYDSAQQQIRVWQGSIQPPALP